MSEFIKILRSRRSIRKFSDTPISDDQLSELKEALLRSPTSRGRNPWQFILVDDPELLQKISLAKAHGSNFLAGAKAAFVICADENVSDVWVEDCAIAAITLQYAAHAIGLGSCWAQIRLRDHNDAKSAESYLGSLFDLPNGIRIDSIIGIGHPAETKSGHPERDLAIDKFHYNSY